MKGHIELDEAAISRDKFAEALAKLQSLVDECCLSAEERREIRGAIHRMLRIVWTGR